MSDTKTTVVRSGIGLPTLLTLIFLVLQLTGNIDWPWYAIVAPIFIAWGIGIVIFLGFFVLALLAA